MHLGHCWYPHCPIAIYIIDNNPCLICICLFMDFFYQVTRYSCLSAEFFIQLSHGCNDSIIRPARSLLKPHTSRLHFRKACYTIVPIIVRLATCIYEDVKVSRTFTYKRKTESNLFSSLDLPNPVPSTYHA